MYARVTAPPKDKARCKLSVIAEATAAIEEVVDPTKLAPYEKHFHPVPAPGSTVKMTSKRVGQPMHAFTATPYSEQVIKKGETDKWDYCLRRLFVLKTTPLKDAMNSLAPGATSLLKDLTGSNIPVSQRVKTTKSPREMTVADWALVLRAFNNWPFKPEELMIGDAFKELD
ncbi:hypothetical protein BN946_scf185037.g12 [Trametes cinnabarina]|uniref:Uncharacterized protein n=1 Tax=Pycnoporus cinnabarinus TaxID=5643 RepID=A0A060SVE4_PYCCI|nr:hypothetical protein BN946_scf185037.g12 [Trametes cinnabarina]